MRLVLHWPHRDRGGSLEKAEEEFRRAERDLAATKAMTPVYKSMGQVMRELREKNHFAEAFERTFEKG